MKKMNNGELDLLLKKALASEEQPDPELNQALKRKIASVRTEGKTVSLWWLPMLASFLLAGMLSFIGYLFIATTVLQALVFLSSVMLVIFSVVFTILGIRFFDLKKGALIVL